MKTLQQLLRLFLALGLLVAVAEPSLALMDIGILTKEKAKEWGLTVKAHKNGMAGIAVTVEFKMQGELKSFNRAELQVWDGKKYEVLVPVMVVHPTPDSVSVTFSGDPAFLAKSQLMIILSEPPMDGSGYEMQVKEFVDLAKVE